MAKARPAGPEVKIKITSETAIKAVQERIEANTTQRDAAMDAGVARIYDGVSAMLTELLEAGAEGARTSVLMAKVRVQVPGLTHAEEDEVLQLLKGNLTLVRSKVNEQK